jgi:hypothetical protein
MNALIRVVALSLSLLPVMVSAQEPQSHPLAGAWRGSIASPDGQSIELIVEMRIQGDVVTGPVFAPVGEVYMRSGTVTANSVAFTTPRLSEADRDVPMVWTGQLSGDNTLAVSVVPEGGGTAIELVLTKDTAQ